MTRIHTGKNVEPNRHIPTLFSIPRRSVAQRSRHEKSDARARARVVADFIPVKTNTHSR